MTEEDIFLAALDRPPAERPAYLDVACAGDADLRGRVEALLRSHDDAGSFLGRPAVEQVVGLTPSAGPDGTRTDPSAGTAPDPSAAEVPERLGTYRVLELIGRGGMGAVYRAFDEKLQRVVAIKVLAAELAASATARRRFVREARAAAAVCHEHVIAVHAVEEDHRPPFLVMQFVDGISLQEKLDRAGPLGVREVLRIGLQTAEGLAAAHKQGLVHRDVKPSNILLENGVERVKLTDFGLARAADDASLTQSGVIAGTPQYMSPEQAEGRQVDARSDLFSLGSVLYAMLTGRPPFRASGTMAVLKRVCEEAPRPIREVNPEAPDWLCAIVERLHAKRPEDRFESAKEVADLLAQHLAHLQQPTRVPMPAPVARPSTASVPPPAPRWFQLQVFCFVLAGLLLVLASRFIFEAVTNEAGRNQPTFVGIVVLLALAGVAVTLARRQRPNLPPQGQVPMPPPVARPPAPAARRGRRVLTVALLGLLVLLLTGAVWAGPAVVRYLRNRGEVEIVPRPGLVSVIVVQNGVPVGDYMDMRTPHTLTLPAGQYQLNMRLKTGYSYEWSGWEVEKSWLIGGSKVLTAGPSLQLTVAPGERVTVRALPREAPKTVTAQQPAERGWVQLFNGRDLTGWKTHPDQPGDWRVDTQGVLVGSGNTGHLFTQRGDFGDFHLRAEVRVSQGGNGGVYVRVPAVALPRFGGTFPVGLVAKVDGSVLPLGREPTGSLARELTADGPAETVFNLNPPPKPGEWFTLEVLVSQGTVAVKVNGETTAQTILVGPEFARGHIALQVRDPGSVIEFRRIEVKNLPAGDPAAGPRPDR